MTFETASTARFIPEAADSKLMSSERFGEDAAQDHVMRLRLHVATRLLFGDEIVIPQGWAIDSVGLFQVISEVEEAVGSFPAGRLPASLASYSPFKMECHVGTANYMEALVAYLSRKDCRWSGIPQLRNQDIRHKVLQFIGPATRDPASFSAEAFGRAATEVVGNEKLAYAWGKTVAYFSLPGSRRVLRGTLPPNAYISQVLEILPAQHKAHDAATDPKELRPRLVEFRSQVKLLSESWPNMPTSALISLAEETLEPDAISIVNLISTFAQTQVAATATGSASSAPIRSIRDAEWRVLGDELIIAGLGKKADISSIYVAPGLEINLQVAQRLALKKTNWSEVWRQIIQLAHRDDWIEVAGSLQREALPWQRNYELPDYRRMTSILEQHCPEFLIKRSGLEGLFLHFKITLPEGIRRGVENVVDNAISTGSKLLVGAGGVAAHSIGMSLPSSAAIVGALALVTPGLKGAPLNPARAGEIGSRVIPVFSPKGSRTV